MSLVSKFENMASGHKKEAPMARQANGLSSGTKGRGWKGAMGFGKKEDNSRVSDIREEEGLHRERVDSMEFAKGMRKDEKLLERKVGVGKGGKDGSEGSVKSQNSLIVRGKKEGRRLLNGLSGRVRGENKSGKGSGNSGNRRESLVQLRVRALETVKGTKATKDRTSLLRDEVVPGPYRAPAPPGEGSESIDLTPTTTHTQDSSNGKGGRQRQKLQKPKPISSKPNKSSNLLPKADTTAKESIESNGSAKPERRVLTKKNPSSQARNRSEVSSDSVHDFEGDPRANRPSEAQVFSLAARPDHGAPRKSVAPTIRERITMFESAKATQSTSIVALLGAGATAALKRRIADEGAEDGAEVKDNEIMKRVEYGRSEEKLQSPQMGTMEEPSLTSSADKERERKHSKSPISRYLDERKRSSISTQGSADGKVNGHYVSSFSNRRSGVASPETTRAVMAAVKATTPMKKSSSFGLPPSTSSPAKMGMLRKAPPLSGRDSPTLTPGLQDMVMRRQSERNALSAATSRHTSRQPSPHSMDGHNSVGKHNQPLVLTGGPVRRPHSAVPMELVAPPAAPVGTPPGTVDERVAELIALAAEDDEPIISKGVAEDYQEIERLGSAIGGIKEVPIGYNQYLNTGSARGNGGIRVAHRAIAPRVRTPLQRTRSSMSRMLGRDGPAPDNRDKDDVATLSGTPTRTPAQTPGLLGAPAGEGKENILSDEDSSHGAISSHSANKSNPFDKLHLEKTRKVSEQNRKVSDANRKASSNSKRSISDSKRKEALRLEEERTLVVRSEVTISEPKPLRLVEISRMLRMARFGRSRSGGRLTGY